MLVPAFGPVALAGSAAPEAMHCMRKPFQQTAQAAAPAMHCHHGLAHAPQPASAEASFSSLDCACQNHDCCRGLKTCEWARPASNSLSCASFLIEPALLAPIAARVSAVLTGPDSARAPPLS